MQTNKPQYNILQNLAFMVRMAWKTRKRVLIFCLLIPAIQLALNMAELYVTPVILSKLGGQREGSSRRAVTVSFWRIKKENTISCGRPRLNIMPNRHRISRSPIFCKLWKKGRLAR